jgi:hypothetical protein
MSLIRAIVLASVSLRAFAQDEEMAPPEGFGTCRCLGKNNLGLEKAACTYEWQDTDGNCVATVPNKTAFKWYPGSYGESCQKHHEPGASECFDITTDPPSEKKLSAQETWCNDPWCYVDSCACDVKATSSSYFPDQLDYSYATCGSRNNFLTESDLADASTAVGDATCKKDGKGATSSGGGDSAASGGGGSAAKTTTAGPGMAADDAKSLTVGLGMVLVGVALA